MRRAKTLYFGFLSAAIVLFGLAALLTLGARAAETSMSLARFVILSAAAGCAIGTWGAAVMIASVHKKAWPLLLTVCIVVCAGVAFAVACSQA